MMKQSRDNERREFFDEIVQVVSAFCKLTKCCINTEMSGDRGSLSTPSTRTVCPHNARIIDHWPEILRNYKVVQQSRLSLKDTSRVWKFSSWAAVFLSRSFQLNFLLAICVCTLHCKVAEFAHALFSVSTGFGRGAFIRQVAPIHMIKRWTTRLSGTDRQILYALV